MFAHRDPERRGARLCRGCAHAHCPVSRGAACEQASAQHAAHQGPSHSVLAVSLQGSELRLEGHRDLLEAGPPLVVKAQALPHECLRTAQGGSGGVLRWPGLAAAGLR